MKLTLPTDNYKLLGTALFAGLLYFLLAIVGWHLTDQDRAHTYLVGILGVGLGWMIGILSAPYTEEEKARFGEYTGLLASFLSGYGVSKFDRLFEMSFERGRFEDPIFLARTAFFVSGMIITVVVVYGFR